MKYLIIGGGVVSLLLTIVVSAASLIEPDDVPQKDVADALIVYKSPTCGCCSKWIEHVESNEFVTDPRNVSNLHLIKQEYGVAPKYQSCHTAVHHNGLVFEGHVPAAIMTRLIENPVENAIGLSVPGMPVGSPGMEYGDRVDTYEVKLLLKDGSSRTYAQVDRSGVKYLDQLR